MAYDDDLADRIRELLGTRDYAEKRMFGGLAFLIGGHMSVSVSREGGLLVRVEPDQTEVLLREAGAEEMVMGGRGPMVGWVRVRPEAVVDEPSLQRWVDRGVGFALSLPPK